MTIEINFTKAEFALVREALKEKFNDLMEHLDDAEYESETLPTLILNAQKVQAMQEDGVEEQAQTKAKKPHWTQTPEGKKKMAARKRRGARK